MPNVKIVRSFMIHGTRYSLRMEQLSMIDLGIGYGKIWLNKKCIAFFFKNENVSVNICNNSSMIRILCLDTLPAPLVYVRNHPLNL